MFSIILYFYIISKSVCPVPCHHKGRCITPILIPSDISYSAEYIGMECPIQPDRQNQGERIPRKMDLHDYYAFVDIQVDSISDSAEYIGME